MLSLRHLLLFMSLLLSHFCWRYCLLFYGKFFSIGVPSLILSSIAATRFIILIITIPNPDVSGSSLPSSFLSLFSIFSAFSQKGLIIFLRTFSYLDFSFENLLSLKNLRASAIKSTNESRDTFSSFAALSILSKALLFIRYVFRMPSLISGFGDKLSSFFLSS